MKYKAVRPVQTHPKEPVADKILPFLAVLFLAGLPFVVSFTGFEKFRIPKDVFTVVCILLMALTLVVSRRFSFRRWPGGWEILLLVALAYTAIHTLIFSNQTASWMAVAFTGCFIVLFFILKSIASFSFQRTVWLWIGAALAANAIFTVLQFYGHFPILTEAGETLSGRLNPAGFIGEVSSGGFLFGLISLILLHFLSVDSQSSVRKLAAVLLILNLTGLAFTRTLAAIAAFGVGLAVWLIFHHWWLVKRKKADRKKLAAVWGLLLVLLAGLTGVSFTSGALDRVFLVWGQIQEGDWNVATSGRQPVYLLTWEMIQEKPVTGRGLNTFGRDFFFFRAETEEGQSVSLIPQPGAFREVHNEYLQIWEELGTPGLLLFLALLIFPLVRSAMLVFREKDAGTAHWIATLSAGLIFVCVNSLAYFPFHVSVTAAYIVLLLASLRYYQTNRNTAPVAGLLEPGYGLEKVARMSLAVIVVLVLGTWEVQKWIGNREAGIATVLLENARSPEFRQVQKRAIAGEALSRLQRAQNLAPRLHEIYNLKGSAAMFLGRYEDAAENYARAADMIPSPEVYTNLAAACLAQKKNQQARRYAQLALNYNPSYVQARQVLEYLEDTS